MAVRSNYIKNLMDTKNSLDKQYEEVIKESMKNIIGDNAKEEVRKLLKESEDEDSYSEEEVTDDITVTDKDGETPDTEAGDEESVETGVEVDDTEATDDVVDTESGEGDDELWDDLEKCKSADGEYDCRGMEDGKLFKVLKAMGPEDGIRVMSNDDGTIEIEVDGDSIEGTQDFIIELEGEDTDLGESKNLECNESNTGYTSDYQKETAMTTPDNHEPANPKTTYSMDAGVPKGTEKPFANQGDKSPYSDTVNENDETVFDVEIDDDEQVNEAGHTVTQNNGAVRGVTTKEVPNSSSQKYARNGHVEAQSPTTGGRGTGDGYQGPTESFKRKMNQIWSENKQMKSIIPQLNQKLMESMVINASMGYIVRLLNENTTTVDEKKQITERFSKVNTLEEGKKLYETISDELKVANKRSNGVSEVLNMQIAEGSKNKQSLVETTMYKSEKVNEVLDFMKRIDKIK